MRISDLTATTPMPGWCGTCSLPSRVTFEIVWLEDDGVSTLATVTQCENCEEKP